jgi:hypothetical protein
MTNSGGVAGKITNLGGGRITNCWVGKAPHLVEEVGKEKLLPFLNLNLNLSCLRIYLMFGGP